MALPQFEVIDTRSAQGRLDPRPKTVTIADFILFHGHACDGLLRGAYALRALADVAFPGRPFDRTDLLVVSKNSPCLGDIAAYLTGGRARFGTHRLDDTLGLGFIVQMLSTGQTWEVREEPGFFPPLIAAWDAAVLDPALVEHGILEPADKAELIAINEAAQWNWVRAELLSSRPADHYVVRNLDNVELPDALHAGRRTDVLNRDVPGPCSCSSPYEPGPDSHAPRPNIDDDSVAAGIADAWRDRYLAGPPRRHEERS
ncbi:MAG: formylmethanofuran dehydrogenase subunit E family protein [Microthrixaceae bacterium]